METLSSIGSTILLLIMYSNVNALKISLIQWSFFLFPSILNVFDSFHKRKFTETRLNLKKRLKLSIIVSVLSQFSSILIWTTIIFIENERLSHWLIPISVYLVSLNSWPDYVHSSSPIRVFSRLSEAKDRLIECGHELYQTVASFWRIVLTFAIFSLFISLSGDIEWDFNLNNLFESNHLLENSFNKTSQTEVKVHLISILPFTVIALYVISSIISGHLSRQITSKIPSKRMITYFIALIFGPIVILITFLTLHFKYTNDCQRISENFNSYLVFVNLYDLNRENVSINILIVLSLITFISFVTTVYNTNYISNQLQIDSNNSCLTKTNLMNIPSIHSNAKFIDLKKFYDRKYRVFLCPTMWHEEQYEMQALISSLFNLFREHQRLGINYYTLQTHIFIDDAFDEMIDTNGNKWFAINSYVKDLIDTTKHINHEFGYQKIGLTQADTPYGQQIEFNLGLNYKLIAHLKNPNLIRKGMKFLG